MIATFRRICIGAKSGIEARLTAHAAFLRRWLDALGDLARRPDASVIEQNLGEALGERLSGHATLLHRWLDALHERAGRSRIYLLFEQAMKERKQIACVYDGYRRELCPIILEHSEGEEKALTYQFAGAAKTALPSGGQWKCFWLSGVSEVQLRDGLWHAGSRHGERQRCVEIVDLDVNPASPYNPKRRVTTSSRSRRTPAGNKRASS